MAPAFNEQDNIVPLLDDVERALSPSVLRYEMVVIDDGSTDLTADRLREQLARRPWLRVFRMSHTPPGRGNGQSAAFYAGLREARGELVALMDADLQNDPADIPAMLRLLRQEHADMVQGDRSANRADTFVRRITSWVGRTFRRTLLGDTIRDTGCSLRVLKREPALRLPLQYKGVHRFIPFYFRLMGCKVVEMPVRHRPRTAGQAKYGIWNRAIPGLLDLLAVRWMRSRLRSVGCTPVETRTPQPTHHTTEHPV